MEQSELLRALHWPHRTQPLQGLPAFKPALPTRHRLSETRFTRTRGGANSPFPVRRVQGSGFKLHAASAL